MIWKVPRDFTVRPDLAADDIQDVAPASRLSGHTRKVGHVQFNPAAQNVLASSSGDYSIKLWDIDAESSKLVLKHGDIVQSLSWSGDGKYLTTTCRDKKLRVWDVRQEKPVVETLAHSGAKAQRAVWMGDHDRIATTGFSKMSDRQLGLWDVRACREPLDGFTMLDQMSGVCIPFWDEGTEMLYLAGKGDGNIRYYEFQNDKFEFLSQHTSPEPLRGIGFMPKRGIDTRENEIMRAYRTIEDRIIEPISFIVPRRAEVFQTDIYPPTAGLTPAMSSGDWFAGKDGTVPKISLESLYEGEGEKLVPSGSKASEPIKSQDAPASNVEPKAEPKGEPKTLDPAPESTPVVHGPPSSVKDNQASIASMASKFQDKEEVEDDEDDSSFEEVQKPVERANRPSTLPKSETPFEPPKPIATAAPVPPASVPTPSAEPEPTPTLPRASEQTHSAHRSTPSGQAAAGLRGDLADIKSLLESQNQTILKQGQQLLALTREMEKMKVGSSGPNNSSKDERIRMLELELEAARGA